jgi:hypothetical protein
MYWYLRHFQLWHTILKLSFTILLACGLTLTPRLCLQLETTNCLENILKGNPQLKAFFRNWVAKSPSPAGFPAAPVSRHIPVKTSGRLRSGCSLATAPKSTYRAMLRHPWLRLSRSVQAAVLVR